MERNVSFRSERRERREQVENESNHIVMNKFVLVCLSSNAAKYDAVAQ